MSNAQLHPSAAFQISSTTKGLLLLRMTSTQRQTSPTVEGLLIYDTDLGELTVHQGDDGWKALVGKNPVYASIIAEIRYDGPSTTTSLKEIRQYTTDPTKTFTIRNSLSSEHSSYLRKFDLIRIPVAGVY